MRGAKALLHSCGEYFIPIREEKSQAAITQVYECPCGEVMRLTADKTGRKVEKLRNNSVYSTQKFTGSKSIQKVNLSGDFYK